MTGLPTNHKSFNLPLDGFLHVTSPHHYFNAEPGETEEEFSERLAKELEQTIEKEDPSTIAAFIAEPVMGAGGVGAALGALRVGVLTDRWGSARVAAGALAVIAAGSCLLGTTSIVALLAICLLYTSDAADE